MAMNRHPRGVARAAPAALLTCVMATASVVRAQSEDAAGSLEWKRSSEGKACPDRSELTAALTEQLGRDPFAATTGPRVVVELAREKNLWSASLRRFDAEGHEEGRQTLTSSSEDCDELFAATVAALVVIAGDDDEETDAEAAPDDDGLASAALPATEPEPPPPAAARPPKPTTPTPSPTTAPVKPPPSAQPRPKKIEPRHYLGLGFAYDLAILPNVSNVCGDDTGFDCYTADGDEFSGVASPTPGNQIRRGLGVGPGRILLEYHHRLGDHLGLEGRGGVVVLDRARGALPAHLELGATYWPRPVRRRARAFLGLSAGVAAFDPHLETTVLDCSTEAFPEGDPNCSAEGTHVVVDAVRRTGFGFVAASLGAYWRFTPHGGLLIRDTVYVTIPSGSFVIEPNLGYVYGW